MALTTVHDSAISAQLPYIAKIIDDETWLEAERRGHPVDARDPVVVERVCAIILRHGGELRDFAMRCRLEAT